MRKPRTKPRARKPRQTRVVFSVYTLSDKSILVTTRTKKRVQKKYIGCELLQVFQTEDATNTFLTRWYPNASVVRDIQPPRKERIGKKGVNSYPRTIYRKIIHSLTRRGKVVGPEHWTQIYGKSPETIALFAQSMKEFWGQNKLVWVTDPNGKSWRVPEMDEPLPFGWVYGRPSWAKKKKKPVSSDPETE